MVLETTLIQFLKKNYSDANTYYSTPNYIQTIILKINQESEYQVRPISFFLIIQKSMNNLPKNSLKKLTFTTLPATHFESFFRKFEVIPFLFTKFYIDSEKIVLFF